MKRPIRRISDSRFPAWTALAFSLFWGEPFTPGNRRSSTERRPAAWGVAATSFRVGPWACQSTG